LRLIPVTLLIFFVWAVPALADDTPPSNTTNALSSNQFWVAVLGAIVPLATYLINHYGPQTSEKVKALVLVVVTAIVGGVYTAISTGNFAFDTPTLQIVGTAVVAALVAHKVLWLPSTVSILLGGGSNKPGQVPDDAPPTPPQGPPPTAV